MDVVNAQADDFGDLGPMLERLKALLADVELMQAQLVTASRLEAERVELPPTASDMEALREGLETVAKAAETAASGKGAAASDVRDAAQKALDATSDEIRALATALIPAVDETDPLDTQELAQTIRANTNKSKLIPSIEKSTGSDRYMSLTMYMTSDEMDQSSSMSSSFSQTSWRCSLFFGSAGGTRSTSKLDSAKDFSESSTAIEIGMKVAKVDIERNWFEPGLFKLTGAMNRLSSTPISTGAVNTSADNSTPEEFKKSVSSILPCFPVSFLIAKDVSIRFKASSSHLHAVKHMLDSKSAVGGGFLCFSASHSKASHKQSSSVSSKTDGQMVTININSPQIMGWFLEFPPEDKSTPIAKDDAKADAMYHSISQYIEVLRSSQETADSTPQ